MYVFGAGASFDSDPERLPEPDDALFNEHRPPLATGLFKPPSNAGIDAIARYPRAAPIIMRLRNAVTRGADVEETLEAIAGSDAYPELKPQLLSFRAYLTDLLWEVPMEWAKECQGLTNYVPLLDWSDRRIVESGESSATVCVTFNYDTLLEDAVARVYGHQISALDRYQSHPRIRVYKPHGSAHWQMPASWDERSYFNGRDSVLREVIARAAEVQFHPEQPWRLQNPHEHAQDLRSPGNLWLPAISIPIRNKADFTLPDEHLTALKRDLAQVSTLVAVGWRGRERHFLRLLQEHMPSARARLMVVSVNEVDARATIESLWETGRFDRYAISTRGFSGFVDERSQDDFSNTSGEGPSLQDLLSDVDTFGIWTNRQPGHGLVSA